MLNFVIKKGRELELIYITVSYSNIIRYNNILLKTFISNLNIGSKIFNTQCRCGRIKFSYFSVDKAKMVWTNDVTFRFFDLTQFIPNLKCSEFNLDHMQFQFLLFKRQMEQALAFECRANNFSSAMKLVDSRHDPVPDHHRSCFHQVPQVHSQLGFSSMRIHTRCRIHRYCCSHCCFPKTSDDHWHLQTSRSQKSRFQESSPAHFLAENFLFVRHSWKLRRCWWWVSRQEVCRSRGASLHSTLFDLCGKVWRPFLFETVDTQTDNTQL